MKRVDGAVTVWRAVAVALHSELVDCRVDDREQVPAYDAYHHARNGRYAEALAALACDHVWRCTECGQHHPVPADTEIS